MLILKYAVKTQETEELEERLRQLTLAHQVELAPEVKEPVLVEGRITFTGRQKINEHLDELARELYFWQYCNCAPVDA